jgi:protocatechuate 3,4-dioxygenase beta subunit
MTKDHMDDHDHGLSFDLQTLRRRRVIGGLATLGLVGAGAAIWGRNAFGSEAEISGIGADGNICVGATVETQGPFPADGSNGVNGTTSNVLVQSGVQRADIRSSFAGMQPMANGIALTVTLQLVNVAAACAPLAGYAVYIWHCDAAGRYSIYEAVEANYLRGLGVTDGAGEVQFKTILPGCYNGRWPHIHFEVFSTVDAATAGDQSLLISQMALPGDVLSAQYAADARYAQSAANLALQAIGVDGIFADNTAAQLAAQTIIIAGDPATGLTGRARLGIAV